MAANADSSLPLSCSEASDRHLDLDDRRQSRSHSTADGRPSVDPELMIRMPRIVGYSMGIQSECEEVYLNFAYRWFCQLRPDGDTGLPR